MYTLGRDFAIRKVLDRIKAPDSVTLLRPIKKLPGNWVEGVGAGVAHPLCFRQIGFVATKPVFNLLGFIDVNSQAIPSADSPLTVAHWLTASVVPTKFAVRPTQAMYSLVGSPSLNCVLEGLQSFWQVIRVHEPLPTTFLEIFIWRADIVQNAPIGIAVFTIGLHRPDEAWYRVDDLPKLVFAFLQCFLGTPVMPAGFCECAPKQHKP